MSLSNIKAFFAAGYMLALLQVGFEVIQVVDDGQTQIGRAGRVNPEFERRGLIKQFSSWLDGWRMKNNIKRISFAATDANPAVTRPSFLKKNKHILTKVCTFYMHSKQETRS